MKNPIAFITGGGCRLGRHIALALAEGGYDVVINYHQSEEGAAKTVAEIQGKGYQALAIQGDVSQRQDVERMIATALHQFEKIDLLVNNAGVFPTLSFFEITDDIWQDVLGVNLNGAFLCSQVAAKAMVKQGGGKIINIASIGGLQAWATHIPYCVSKAGLIMLTQGMAKALAPQITVNAIAPGEIMMNAEQPTLSLQKIPLNRYGEAKDITDAVLFLSRAEYMTGQILVVDGGKTLTT